jgi:hypothetical protein
MEVTLRFFKSWNKVKLLQIFKICCFREFKIKKWIAEKDRGTFSENN